MTPKFGDFVSIGESRLIDRWYCIWSPSPVLRYQNPKESLRPRFPNCNFSPLRTIPTPPHDSPILLPAQDKSSPNPYSGTKMDSQGRWRNALYNRTREKEFSYGSKEIRGRCPCQKSQGY